MKNLKEFFLEEKEWFERYEKTIRDYANKLQESEEWLSTTLKSIGDALIATDKLGNVRFMNPVAETLTGWKQEEAMGKPLEGIFNIFNEETRKKVENPVLRVLREGIVVGLANHTILIAKDGTEIPIADSGAPIKDDNGNINGVVLIFRDITERRKLEIAAKEAREYAESIVETVRESILVLDKDLRVISANKSFYDTFKVSPEESENALLYDLGDKQWDIPKLRDLLEKILPKNTKFEDYELEHDFETIGRRIMVLNARRIYREANKTQMILLAIDDITERRKLEIAAKVAREYAESIVETVREPILVLDKDLRVISANKSFYDTFKVSPEESENALLYDLGDKQWDIPKLRELLEKILPKNTKFEDYELEHDFETIGKRIMVLNARRIYREANKTQMILLAIEDITERKKAENLIKESQKQLNSILSSQKDLVLVIHKNYEVAFKNPVVYEVFGKELADKKCYEIIKGWDHPCDQCPMEELNRSGKCLIRFEQCVLFSTSNETKLFDVIATPIENYGGKPAIVEVLRDITHLKKVEQKLKESEERFRRIIENAPFGYYRVGKDGFWQYVNPVWEQMQGYSLQDVVGKSFEMTQTEDDKDQARETVLRALSGETITGEFSRLTKDGGIEYHTFNIQPVYQEGNIIAIEGYINDISERKKIEEELMKHRDYLEEKVNERTKRLKESEEWLSTTLKSIGDAVIATDQLGNIRFMNPVAETLTGWKQEEATGKTLEGIFNIVNEETRKKVENPVSRVLREDGVVGLANHSILISKDGTEIPIADSGAPIKDDEGNVIGIVLIFRDITESKKTEQKLKESEEMYREAFNRVNFYKGLFAHDMNNILQSFLSGMELSEVILDDPSNLEELKINIGIMKNQIIRGANLISNVRKLSQLEEIEIPINKIEMCNFLKNSISILKKTYQDKNINIQVHSIGEKLYIQANNFIEDVFENILINAVKHNKNTSLEITVRISRNKKKSVNYLKMEFLDNGIGMSDTRKKLIFQRGYMEGKSVHGMGLGLSLVKKIVESYNGEIWVEDRVKGDHSKGSNFILLIPEVD